MEDLFDMTGKVAIITGSSRGIGKAIAEQFVARGANVVISSRKAEACASVAAALNESAGRLAAISVPANIGTKEELQHLVDQTVETFGDIDVLVCNAATNTYLGPMSGIKDDQFRKILENNILSNHWLIQMVTPGMIRRREGSVLIISSAGGLRGSPILGTYGISKAGDFILARNLAVEYGKYNIRVNCIAPGTIRTDMARAAWEDPEMLRRTLRGVPLARVGDPEEIAGAAVFLTSPAGAFVTGHTLVVDGGLSA